MTTNASRTTQSGADTFGWHANDSAPIGEGPRCAGEIGGDAGTNEYGQFASV